MPTKSLHDCVTHAIAVAGVAMLGLAPLTTGTCAGAGLDQSRLARRRRRRDGRTDRAAHPRRVRSFRVQRARRICVGLHLPRHYALGRTGRRSAPPFELTALGILYAGATFASVKLPSQPAAEITMGGGIRPTLGDITFDFGWTSLFLSRRGRRRPTR